MRVVKKVSDKKNSSRPQPKIALWPLSIRTGPSASPDTKVEGPIPLALLILHEDVCGREG